MHHAIATSAVFLSLAMLTACGGAGGEETVTAFTGIAEDEVVILGGTEPFWGAKISGETVLYTTPPNLDGTMGDVTRFAGNGGLSYSGTLGDTAFHAMVTPGECSDGMSDRTYPFTATVRLGEELLTGCGHSNMSPYQDLALKNKGAES